MRTLKRCLTLAAACTLTLASAVAAQDGGKMNNRTGLWGGFGFGYGILGALDCNGCGTEGALSGNARIGFTLSPEVRLAVGTNGWYKDVDGVGFTAGLLSAQVLWYPGGQNVFLLGGAGYFSADCDYCSGNSGLGFVIGTGYDIPINDSGSLALTPYINWIPTTAENNPYILQAGLGLTFN